MSIESNLRQFAVTLERIHHDIEPIKQQTMLLEDKIGYDDPELIDASDLVIRQQDSLQREYAEKAAQAADNKELEVLLKEFEEQFYNVVLDYKNKLQEMLRAPD